MTSRKQKYNVYSTELKKEILDKHKEGRLAISLAEEYGMTQEELSLKVGKSRSAVANAKNFS